ncbi:unnamed protein product [Arctogadus glacialis]
MVFLTASTSTAPIASVHPSIPVGSEVGYPPHPPQLITSYLAFHDGGPLQSGRPSTLGGVEVFECVHAPVIAKGPLQVHLWFTVRYYKEVRSVRRRVQPQLGSSRVVSCLNPSGSPASGGVVAIALPVERPRRAMGESLHWPGGRT